jgi:hypothetical protein
LEKLVADAKYLIKYKFYDHIQQIVKFGVILIYLLAIVGQSKKFTVQKNNVDSVI